MKKRKITAAQMVREREKLIEFQNNHGWARFTFHILRRIAAAERRGYKKCQRDNWKRFTTRPK